MESFPVVIRVNSLLQTLTTIRFLRSTDRELNELLFSHTYRRRLDN